MPVRTDEFH